MLCSHIGIIGILLGAMGRGVDMLDGSRVGESSLVHFSRPEIRRRLGKGGFADHRQSELRAVWAKAAAYQGIGLQASGAFEIKIVCFGRVL